MVQVLQPREKQPKKSFGESILGGFAEALPGAIQKFQELSQSKQKMQQENKNIKQLTGQDISGIADPDQRKAIVIELLKQQGKGQRLEQQQSYLDQVLGDGRNQEANQHGPERISQAQEGFDAANLTDAEIIRAEAMGMTGLREAKDSALKQKREKEKFEFEKKKSSPEYLREQELTASQAKADASYLNELNERRSKQILKKESLNRLEQMTKKKVTGKAYEKFLENAGLTALTSEGRREYSAEAKNQFTDFKQIAGSQLSASEFFILSGAYPNADFTPEANQAIIDNLKEVHDTLDKEFEIAQRLKKENKGKPPEYIQEKVNTELQDYTSKKIQRVKENIKTIMNAQYGIPKGFNLMFDPKGEPISVPDDKVVDMLDAGANFP